MNHIIKPITNDDRKKVIDLFNYYVENSFAAFPEKKVPYSTFDMFMQMSKGLPTGVLKDDTGKVIGFGMLRTFHPLPAFSRTAEITCFIDNSYTGKGFGKDLLAFLEKEGLKTGIINILANISSLNPKSIKFHRQNGFKECGCFLGVGKKNNRVFDTVWLQKIL
jgi:L-amino acid N-acyltransferase YncA